MEKEKIIEKFLKELEKEEIQIGYFLSSDQKLMTKFRKLKKRTSDENFYNAIRNCYFDHTSSEVLDNSTFNDSVDVERMAFLSVIHGGNSFSNKIFVDSVIKANDQDMITDFQRGEIINKSSDYLGKAKKEYANSLNESGKKI